MILLLNVIIIFEQVLHSIGELVGAQLRKFVTTHMLRCSQLPTKACEALRLFIPAVINY